MEQQNTALGFLNINSDVETMSSRDIAKITGKELSENNFRIFQSYTAMRRNSEVKMGKLFLDKS